MRSSINILNARFDPVTLAQSVDAAMDLIQRNERGYFVTVNVAILMMMRNDPRLERFISRSALTVADGQPLVWASRLLGAPLPERVTGIDMLPSLLRRAELEGVGVYLLGATDDVISKVVRDVRGQFPGLRICGWSNGYFADDEAEARVRAVADSGAQLLIVGMGVPRQEQFLDAHWDALGVNVALGVGGSFDVMAGLRRRAPSVLQKVGLEWLVRLVQEPRRLAGRYLVTNSQFIYLLFRALLTSAVGTRGREDATW